MKSCCSVKSVCVGVSDLLLRHLVDLEGLFFFPMHSQNHYFPVIQLSSLVTIPKENETPAVVKMHFAKCGVQLCAVMSQGKNFNNFSIIVIDIFKYMSLVRLEDPLKTLFTAFYKQERNFNAIFNRSLNSIGEALISLICSTSLTKKALQGQLWCKK